MKTNRRQFLRTAAMAGAAPLILPSLLRAAETAPANRINLGFIGIGAQGHSLLRACLPRKDVQVLAVCDVDGKRRELARDDVKKAYADTGARVDGYEDFRELLARKDIDAVVIATPDHWHALTAIAAANAGKDIYCEKPMAHTVHEGRAMVNAVRANRRVFQVGSMQRSMGEFRAACELIRNGVIGTVAKVDVAVGPSPRPCDLPAEPAEPGLNWDLWLGPAPTRPYNSILSPRGRPKGYPQWRQYREYGGGGVCDWGAHHFDIVQWAFGYDLGGPIEFLPPEDPNAQYGGRFRYDNGVEVTHQKGNTIVFYGDKGHIHVNRGKFELYLGDELKSGVQDDYTSLLKKMLPPGAVRLYRSTNHITDWIKAIHSRQMPVCDVEIGHRSATICNLLNQVYFSHQPAKWNPAKEEFRDGTGAPAWLTREYRAPWVVA